MLGTPPAFVLSQDQTLMFNPSQSPDLISLFGRPLSLSEIWLFFVRSRSGSRLRGLRELCSCLSVFTISFSRIAVVVALALTTLIIIPDLPRFVNNFFYFLSSYYIRIIPHFHPQENPPFFALNIPLTGTLLHQFTAGISLFQEVSLQIRSAALNLSGMIRSPCLLYIDHTL